MMSVKTDYGIKKNLRDIVEICSHYEGDRMSATEAYMLIGNIICPQKPTAEDIAWAEKRAEELGEEKGNEIIELTGMQDNHKLKAESYLGLLQDAIDLFDAELELCDEVCSPAWIWLATVEYALNELEHNNDN